MSSSSSAQKAKATHDAAMSIIAKETEARSAKTERLRQLRLALEAKSGAVDRVALPRVKTAVSSEKTPRAKRGRTKQAN